MATERSNTEKSSLADDLHGPTRVSLPARHRGGKSKIFRGALAVLAVVLAILLVIWMPMRAWAMNWSATDAEVRATLPGDEAMMDPISASTRAITINAPASAIWPWIVQMGYHRAGWYSYDWIEWLLGCDDYVDGRSATRIHPELQHVKVGDMIYTASGVGSPITHLKQDRYIVVGKTWAFVLKPIGATHTRLIVRTRHGGFFNHHTQVLGGALYLADRLLALPAYEPGLHFLMERKMMLGIKERAERRSRVVP